MKASLSIIIALFAGVQAAYMRRLSDTAVKVCNFIPNDRALVLAMGDVNAPPTKFRECVDMADPPTGRLTMKVMDGGTQVGIPFTITINPGSDHLFYIAPTTTVAGSDMFAATIHCVLTPVAENFWTATVVNACVGDVGVSVSTEISGASLPVRNISPGETGVAVLSSIFAGTVTISGLGVSNELGYSGKGVSATTAILACSGIRGSSGEYAPKFTTYGTEGPHDVIPTPTPVPTPVFSSAVTIAPSAAPSPIPGVRPVNICNVVPTDAKMYVIITDADGSNQYTNQLGFGKCQQLDQVTVGTSIGSRKLDVRVTSGQWSLKSSVTIGGTVSAQNVVLIYPTSTVADDMYKPAVASSQNDQDPNEYVIDALNACINNGALTLSIAGGGDIPPETVDFGGDTNLSINPTQVASRSGSATFSGDGLTPVTFTLDSKAPFGTKTTIVCAGIKGNATYPPKLMTIGQSPYQGGAVGISLAAAAWAVTVGVAALVAKHN